jgi:hypothetical protein
MWREREAAERACTIPRNDLAFVTALATEEAKRKDAFKVLGQAEVKLGEIGK